MSTTPKITWNPAEFHLTPGGRVDWEGKSGKVTVFFIYDYSATGQFPQTPVTLSAYIRCTLMRTNFPTMDEAKAYAEKVLADYVADLGAVFPDQA